MKKETAAIKRLLNVKSKVSSLYYIKKNGNIFSGANPSNWVFVFFYNNVFYCYVNG